MREKKRPVKRLREIRILNRQTFGRKEKSSIKWWDDPTKLIPIVISSIAVVISCLSWWESHRGMRINAEINRPILSLTSLKLFDSGVPTKDEAFPTDLMIVYRFKNTGKSSASLKEVKVEPIFMRIISDEGSQDECGGKGNEARQSFFEKIVLPGDETDDANKLELPPECLGLKQSTFFLAISVNYIDVGAGLSYTQSFLQPVYLSPETFESGFLQVLPTPTPSPMPVSNPSPPPAATPKPKR